MKIFFVFGLLCCLSAATRPRYADMKAYLDSSFDDIDFHIREYSVNEAREEEENNSRLFATVEELLGALKNRFREALGTKPTEEALIEVLDTAGLDAVISMLQAGQGATRLGVGLIRSVVGGLENYLRNRAPELLLV